MRTETMMRTVFLLSVVLGVRALPNPTFLPTSKAVGQQQAEPDCGNPDDFGPWEVHARCTATAVPCEPGEEMQFRSYYGEYGRRIDWDACQFKFLPCSVECGPPVDCVPEADWGPRSPCSALCGGGVSVRSRGIAVHAANGGKPCRAADLIDASLCNQVPCTPIDCVVSDWTEFSECSGPCGTKERKRTVITPPLYGGAGCPSLCETLPCLTGLCEHPAGQPENGPVDCQVSDWFFADPPCTGCTLTRFRTVTVQPLRGGNQCPELVWQQPCSTGPSCTDGPVDCYVSEWTAERCRADCKQQLTRTVTHPQKAGGAPCPELSMERNCIGGDCPNH